MKKTKEDILVAINLKGISLAAVGICIILMAANIKAMDTIASIAFILIWLTYVWDLTKVEHLKEKYKQEKDLKNSQ